MQDLSREKDSAGQDRGKSGDAAEFYQVHGRLTKTSPVTAFLCILWALCCITSVHIVNKRYETRKYN